MSSINGDKARSNRKRRARLKLRESIRGIRAASSKTAKKQPAK
jgi:hypothetical protein